MTSIINRLGLAFLIALVPTMFTLLVAKSSNRLDLQRFKFNPVSSSALPLAEAHGNMNEIINALTTQIKNCKESHSEYAKISIANQTFTRQQWCLNTNQKMLGLAKAANGNFKQFLASIKNEFNWYQSTGWPEKHGKFKKGDVQFTAYYTPANRSRTPFGTENIALTPHASCATDHRLIPIGMVMIYSYKKTTAWCIAQDSGSAVKGAHVDLYKGKGRQAGAEQKGLFYAGSLFVALPKSK